MIIISSNRGVLKNRQHKDYNIVVCDSVVEFATHGDMKNALIKLNGLDLNGRKIRLVDDSKSRGSRKRR